MKIIYYHFDTIDSTNNFAKKKCHQFDEQALTVITASEQTAGRGRRARSWSSLKGKSLCLSFVIQTALNPFFMTQLAALALGDVLHSYSIPSCIKWPNDLLVNGKKIGGILTERQDSSLIIGIGLNVNMTKEDLQSIPQKTTSLYLETEQLFSIDDAVHELVRRFADLILLQDPTCEAKWLERASWIVGQEVIINKDTRPTAVVIASLTSDGTLLCRHADDRYEKLITADIIL